jgi:hypothetical protein
MAGKKGRQYPNRKNLQGVPRGFLRTGFRGCENSRRTRGNQSRASMTQGGAISEVRGGTD